MFGGHFLTTVRALACAVLLLAPGVPAAADGGVADSIRAAADSAASTPAPMVDPATVGFAHGPRGPFAADRLQHASLAFASGLAVGLATEEPAAAAGFAIGLGVTKEMFDDRADWGDLAADLLGAALAAWVTHAVRR